MILNNQQRQFVLTQNQMVPDEGPKALPVRLDFGATSEYTLDLGNFEQLGNISMIQTIFIDASQSPNNINVTANSGQVIVAKAGTQGYYAILISNPASLVFDSPQSSGNVVPVFLINVPIAGATWTTM